MEGNDDKPCLRLFGKMELQLADGRAVQPSLEKARALLGYLALTPGREHTREHLAALLWPDQEGQRALGSLRQAVHRLKSLSEANDTPLINVSRTTIGLRPEYAWQSDTGQFVAYMESGHLRQAAALYRGELLYTLVPPGEVYSDWLESWRRHFHVRAMTVLETLAEDALAAGLPAEAQPFAERQIELDPWLENGHHQLLRSLMAQGAPGAAHSHYRKLCESLERELGIRPGEAIREFMARPAANVEPDSSPAARRAWQRPVHLGPLQRRKLAYLFTLLDREGRGRFGFDSLQQITTQVLANVGVENDADAARQRAADNDRMWWQQFVRFASHPGPELGFDDMLDFWSHWYDRVAREALENNLSLMDMLKDAVDIYLGMLDRDGDGFLDPDEFGTWLKAWAPGDDHASIFCRLDTASRGRLGRTDIVRLLKEFYFSNDPEAPGNYLYGDYTAASNNQGE